MIKKDLEYYLSRFHGLRCASRNGEKSPHKYVVLLTVIHEIESGKISSNLISLTQEFEDRFYLVWHQYVGISANYNDSLHQGFFHLQSEPFWILSPWAAGEGLTHCSDLKSLTRVYEGAIIDEELFTLLTISGSRQKLKECLILLVSIQSRTKKQLDVISRKKDKLVNKDLKYYKKVIDNIANVNKGSKLTISKLIMILSIIEYIQWRKHSYEISNYIPLLASWDGIYLSLVGIYLDIKRNSTAFSGPFLSLENEKFWKLITSESYKCQEIRHNFMTFIHLQDNYDGVEIEQELISLIVDPGTGNKFKKYIENKLLSYKRK